MLVAEIDIDPGAATGSLGLLIGILTAVYVLYDKFKTRNAQDRKDQLEIDKAQVEVKVLANDAIAQAWAALFQERKEAHDRDIRRITKRQDEAEQREQACLERCEKLQEQNERQAAELHAQAESLHKLELTVLKLQNMLQMQGTIPPLSDVHRKLELTDGADKCEEGSSTSGS